MLTMVDGYSHLSCALFVCSLPMNPCKSIEIVGTIYHRLSTERFRSPLSIHSEIETNGGIP